MYIYVKPTSDIFFRYLFGSEENKGLLLSFINSVMIDVDFPTLSSVEIKNPFNLKTIALEKETILDVKALDNTGRQFDIEVQSTGDYHFRARSLYYWAKLYVSQLTEGDQYKTLKPAICINVLDFTLLEPIKRFHSCFMLQDICEPENILTDHLMLHFIELPKFNNKEIKTKIQKWLLYLTSEGKENDIMRILIQEDKEIEKAHNLYEKFTQNDEMMAVYEAREKYNKDHNSLMDSKLEEGKRKGKMEDAKKMLEHGLAVELIADCTGLPIEEIEKLKK